MAKKAASSAALIQEKLGFPVDLEKGRQGQFEIRVNGRTVISRKGGLIAMILRRPWPSSEAVLSAVSEAAG